MDGDKFDNISRKLAHRSTRRDAVRTGGIMAAVAGAFGMRSVARAQDDDEDEPTPCEWSFRALVVSGPNADSTYEGAMQVVIERDGAIDEGTLESEGQRPYQIVGNTRGKAISLVIKISDELQLHLNGVGDRDIRSCEGRIAGTFAGPEFGDIGVWQIERPSDADGDDDDGGGFVAFPTPTAGNSSSNPGPGNPSPTPGATSTPCPPQTCGGAKVWDAQECECVCYEGGVDCGGDFCCPETMICTGNGGCGCSPGKISCNAACYDACPPGQQFDNSSCACVDSVCPTGQAFCGGACIDIVNDEANCGSCGNTCSQGMPCIAGTCKCPATMKYCASSQSCIDENANCP